MIGKPRSDLLTRFTTFNNLSVSCNLFSKAEVRPFGAAGIEGVSDYVGVISSVELTQLIFSRIKSLSVYL